MAKYSKVAVDKAIAASGRSGRPIGGREAEAIHRLLQGRHEPPQAEPEAEPEASTMTKERFIAGLAQLGYNISTAHRLLGYSRTSMYRILRGQAEVPVVVMKLLDMYERHGIPEEHKQP